MDTSKQNVRNYAQTGRITRNVSVKILERLNASGQKSPSGRDYTSDMVRNWLYKKSVDPKIEVAYLSVVSEIDPKRDEEREERREEARRHIEMAEKLLAEV